jgi:hypothetical protein
MWGYELIDSDEKLTRKEFLARSFGLIAAVAVPAALLSRCSGKGGSNSLPAGTPFISFELTFNKPMDTVSFKNALSISPAVSGFSSVEPEWSASNTVVYCRYTLPAAGTTYAVTVAGTAQSAGGIALDGNSNGTGGDSYSFNVPSAVA